MPMLQRWRHCQLGFGPWGISMVAKRGEDIYRICPEARTPVVRAPTPNELVDFWSRTHLWARLLPSEERQPILDFMASGRNPDFDLPADQIPPTGCVSMVARSSACRLRSSGANSPEKGILPCLRLRAGWLYDRLFRGHRLYYRRPPALPPLAAAEAEPNQDILMVIFLRGGMDGMKMSAAVGATTVASMRKAPPDIQIPTASLLALDDRFGLHPAAAALHELYQDKRVPRGCPCRRADQRHAYDTSTPCNTWSLARRTRNPARVAGSPVRSANRGQSAR